MTQAQTANETAPVVKTEADNAAAAAEAREQEKAARSKIKAKYYRTVHGGTMIDPETQKAFNGENAVKSEMTSWLDFQIKNDKIVEDTE